MCLFKKRKICVTHNGTFHADDLFATAVLSILNNGNIKIMRTRDPNIFAKADYLYDVGGENDPTRNKFDHHQRGGAGTRSNGIPYSSLGLVWKIYGEQICGSKEVVDKIDKKLVQPIDAIDNGVDFSKSLYEGVVAYGPDQVFLNQIPTWREDNKNIDLIFKRQVKNIVKFLKREIKVTKDDVLGSNIILDGYNKSSDKRIVILENNFPRYLYQNTLSNLPEPVYVVFPSGYSSMWKVEAIKKTPETMESRKSFPESWRGYFSGDIKLKEIT